MEKEYPTLFRFSRESILRELYLYEINRGARKSPESAVLDLAAKYRVALDAIRLHECRCGGPCSCHTEAERNLIEIAKSAFRSES